MSLGSSQLTALKVLGWTSAWSFTCARPRLDARIRELSWVHTNRPDLAGPRPEPAEASARASSSCRLSRRGLLEMRSNFGWLCRKTILLLWAKVPPHILGHRSKRSVFEDRVYRNRRLMAFVRYNSLLFPSLSTDFYQDLPYLPAPDLPLQTIISHVF